MKIIVYYPKDEKDIKKLAEKVADAQGLAIKNYIEKLSCPKDQKKEILEQVMKLI